MVGEAEAVHGIAQNQLCLSGLGSPEDVVDALWRISQGGRICTASRHQPWGW